MKHPPKAKKQIIFLSVFLLCFFLVLVFLPKIFREHYKYEGAFVGTKVIATSTKEVVVFKPSYVPTPNEVKGIYMTSWVASQRGMREKLVNLIDSTELNSVVIDIKDYSGKIVFPLTSPELKKFGSEEVRVRDMQEFIESLHKKGIYVIGRVAVFQDEYFVKHRPDLAVKNKNGNLVWKDRKGISWIDAGAREYWDYIILVSNEARKVGFDEINFDYIRYPSDGNMQDISFPHSSTTLKTKVMKSFFEYLNKKLVTSTSTDRLKISADLFGMTTTASDDMGIGQLWEDALPYFDYISPMVYPSHYPPTFQGYKEPEAYPYEIVKTAMGRAVERTLIASSSIEKLRPWLQDFGLRMKYGPNEVRAQIRASNELGLDSWLLWSPSNKYTEGALNSL